MDSLEQTDSNRSALRFVSGCRKWINSNDRIRVENTPTFHESIDRSTSSHPTKFVPLDMDDEDEEISSYTRSDPCSSFNHFDVQLQVNNGQPQQAIRYEVFSSITPNEINTFKTNQSSQTIEPEMDMDDDQRRSGGNSRANQDDQRRGGSGGGYRRSQQSNGSSGSGGSADGNGSNPNRNNNNNARRSNCSSDE